MKLKLNEKLSIDKVFNTNTTGTSYYDQLIPGNKDNEYMKIHKNLIGKIVYMTPKDYYEECSKIFTSGERKVSSDNLKFQRSLDNYSNDDIKSAIFYEEEPLDMCYLNYADNQQEGLHRMKIVGDEYGWNKKFPVLVINYFDKEKANKDKKKEDYNKIQKRLNDAILDALKYNYGNVEEFYDELPWHLNKYILDADFSYDGPSVEFIHKDLGDEIQIELPEYGNHITFDKDELNIKKEYEPDDLDDIDDKILDQIDFNDIDSILSYLNNR